MLDYGNYSFIVSKINVHNLLALYALCVCLSTKYAFIILLVTSENWVYLLQLSAGYV